MVKSEKYEDSICPLGIGDDYNNSNFFEEGGSKFQGKLLSPSYGENVKDRFIVNIAFAEEVSRYKKYVNNVKLFKKNTSLQDDLNYLQSEDFYKPDIDNSSQEAS